MRQRVHRLLFWALVAFPLAWACGQDVTVPEPLPDAGSEDAAADTTVPDTSIPDAGPDDAADVECPLVTPDEATGVFVSTTGVNSASCGTKAAPCKTVASGISRAAALKKAKVYAARGTYVEQLTLSAGVEIVGAWDVAGTTWKRTCAGAEDATVIRAPSAESVTVEARDIGGEARLTLLRIESKGQGQADAGESLYGVVAVGATTSLVLTNVHIDVKAAGDGENGRDGDAAAPAPNSCPAGTGAPGASGDQGAGAPAGSFGPTGYVPGEGSLGGDGDAGGNGAEAGAGGCVQCGTCGDFALGCPFVPAGAPSCGKDGIHGCGGGNGGPGGAATGGGSSIGLYAWDATVTITGGRIKTGDGGKGGHGGKGGDGGVGSPGQAGPATDLCIVKCDVGVGECVASMARADGGTAGGDGGAGGGGGPGGGGGGGSSFAIYQGGAGVVTTTGATTLVPGKAGAGGGPDGGAGIPGASAPRVP